MLPQDFYLFPEDLYRVGNSGGPRLTHVREHEVDTQEVNGVLMIQANNRGISVFTEAEVKKGSVTGWAWKIPRTTQLPVGLKLHQDSPVHYMLCPTQMMPLDEYKGLLSKLAVHCQKAFRVEKPAP